MACRLVLALLTVALIPACSSSYYDAYMVQTSALAYAPRMDSTRKISDQDCSKPIVLGEGNLDCR
jgi:hypothetical protein